MSSAFDLQPALEGERQTFEGPDGRISYYSDAPETSTDQPPLLLIHSVNAAASAYEIKPLYDHYRQTRRVIALDLPGYGFSARPKRLYKPRLMTDALLQLVASIVEQHGPVDAIALSLSAEFLARAAMENPDDFRTIGFISPTGFSGDKPQNAEWGTTRAMPWLHTAVAGSDTVGRYLFAGLTSRPSIRYFLRKTWGRKEIDEGAFEYAWLTSHQPGARHAPFSFLSGYLFSADIGRVYDALTHPVWMAHGNRGDFTDYRRKIEYGEKPNWYMASYDTGALPQFECLKTLVHDYDQFVAHTTEASPRD